MGPHAPDPDTQVMLDGIRRIVQTLRLFDREAEKRVGLSGAQVFVLEKLHDGGGLSVNELAQRTHTDQSSVSVVVQKLVKRKLVRRCVSSADARRWNLSMTDRGRRVLESAPPAAQQRLIAAMEQLGRARRRALARSFTEFVAKIGLFDEPPSLFFEYGSQQRSRGRRRKNRRGSHV